MENAVIEKNAPKVKRKKQSQFREVLKRLAKNPSAMIGLCIFVAVILVCAFAPVFAPYDPNEMVAENMYAGSSWAHPCGCDNLGRDVLSRLIYGGRYSLALGFTCAIIGMVLGLFFGSLTGYAGGAVDNVVMRICDIWMAIPGMLLCIILSAVLGNGVIQTIIAMSVGGIPGSIRGTRAMCLRERNMEYLEAAKAMNCSTMKIVFKHMLPNIVAPSIIGTTGQIGGSIMQASGLSFIGLGIPKTIPEWGAMCSSGRDFILTYPHLMVWPGVAILITVLAINMFGDGLRDAMDPRLKD